MNPKFEQGEEVTPGYRRDLTSPPAVWRHMLLLASIRAIPSVPWLLCPEVPLFNLFKALKHWLFGGWTNFRNWSNFD
jgi:hypothetical protein